MDQDSETGFFTPHTYHVDIRFEMGFTQPHELADAIMQAVHRGKRVVVEHFDLIYPFLSTNANLLIGVGEEILVARPNPLRSLPRQHQPQMPGIPEIPADGPYGGGSV